MSAVPSDLRRAVSFLVPSGRGGRDDLHLTARGHCSEGPRSWLEKKPIPDCIGEAEIFAQLQRQAHESCLPQEVGRHWPGLGSTTVLPLLSRVFPSPVMPWSHPEKGSFLPETSPLRSEVSNCDPFFLFFSHHTHPVLSSFLM